MPPVAGLQSKKGLSLLLLYSRHVIVTWCWILIVFLGWKTAAKSDSTRFSPLKNNYSDICIKSMEDSILRGYKTNLILSLFLNATDWKVLTILSTSIAFNFNLISNDARKSFLSLKSFYWFFNNKIQYCTIYYDTVYFLKNTDRSERQS